jgi:hypothetical protein
MDIRSSLNLVAVAALVSVGVAAVVLDQASAHSPSMSTSCGAGEVHGEIGLKGYHGENKVQVWVDGTKVIDGKFKNSYHSLSNLGDPKVKHTYRVRVEAKDDEDFKDGWSVDITKESRECTPDPTTSSSAPIRVEICEGSSGSSHSYRSMNVSSDVVMSTSGHDAHNNDIIPPFEGYPGKNWDKEHREVYSNDCEETENTSPSTSGPENSYPENTDPEDSYPEDSEVEYTTPTTAVPTTVAPTTTTVVVEESTTTIAGTTTTVEATTTTSTVAVAPPTSGESTTTLVAIAPPTVPGNPALPTSGGSPASTVLTAAFGLLLGLVLTLATRRRTLIAPVAE